MTAPKLTHEEIREEAALLSAWEQRAIEQLLGEIATVTAQREAWKDAAEGLEQMPPEPNECTMGPDPFGRQQYDEAEARVLELTKAARALEASAPESETKGTQ